MDRKKFIKSALLTGAVGAIAPHILKAETKQNSRSTYDQLMHQVGFNHLQNKEVKTMNTVIHKANTRGHKLP